MEGFGTQGYNPRDRSRPSPLPLPRTASRSSTSSTKTRMTAQSNNSSASHPLSSPTTSSHSHRYHHSSCTRPPATDRPRSQLSREAIADLQQDLPPVSSFLQEKLQRERKVESERLAARPSNDMMSASLDLRAVPSPPPRSGPLEGRRPRSSGGGDPVKKKGLGLKEMEQAVSTLHKQNFDLKLELFHRRERQAALEDRVEKLEKDKEQTDDVNDRLVAELDKRDKAVEEAVAMIVVLEARVEQLLREREMVRQVDAQGYFSSSQGSAASGHDRSTPRDKTLDLPDLSADLRALNRMPSFLSEEIENTENLRNVYLGVRGSILSLPKMTGDSPDPPGDSPDPGHDDLARINSPSLSLLSESSFLSVYGRKNLQEYDPPPPDDPSPLDGYAEHSATLKLDQYLQQGTATPTTPRSNSASRAVAKGTAKFQHIGSMLAPGESSLQKLERSLSTTNGASRAPGQEREQAQPARRPKAQDQPKTKQEKRDALHRLLTNAPVLNQVANHPQVLPPTPDTISTSTLRHYKNSDDTLSKEQGAANEQSYSAIFDTTTSRKSLSREQGAMLEAAAQGSQLMPNRASEGRNEELVSGSDLDQQLWLSQVQRPRSAGETTVSHRGGINGWDTDSSDDEGFGGVQSAALTYDYWMRESIKPDRVEFLDPLSSVSQTGPDLHAERVSPDLFSFPSSTGGWATEAMFGSLGGNGYLGTSDTVGSPPPLAQTLDALGESLPTPLFGSGLATPVLGGGNVAPPPPNRRSSLHARTGSTSVVVGSGSGPSPSRPAPANGKLRKSPVRVARSRSNSIDGRPPSQSPSDNGLRQDRASTVPPRQLQAPPPSQEEPDRQPMQKQRHYPPTSSQGPRPGPRPRGLSLFRRSTGSTEAPHMAAPSSAPPTETIFRNVPASTVGIPSWGKRNDLVDDDRSSATPPPILRNKGGAPARITNEDGGVALEPLGAAALGGVITGSNPFSASGVPVGPVRPTTPTASVPTGSAGGAPRSEGGGKRKWLGLGRVSSLRSRAA